VIEQTVREKLPEGFQRAEFLLEKGAIDQIIDRREMRDKLYRLLESSFTQTLAFSRKNNITMRLAALSLGVNRVHEAKIARGLFPG